MLQERLVIGISLARPQSAAIPLREICRRGSPVACIAAHCLGGVRNLLAKGRGGAATVGVFLAPLQKQESPEHGVGRHFHFQQLPAH
jgi:hypothetical protein